MQMLKDMKRPISILFERQGYHTKFIDGSLGLTLITKDIASDEEAEEEEEKEEEDKDKMEILWRNNKEEGKEKNQDPKNKQHKKAIVVSKVKPNSQGALQNIQVGDRLIRLEEIDVKKTNPSIKKILELIKLKKRPIEMMFETPKIQLKTTMKQAPLSAKNWSPNKKVWQSMGIGFNEETKENNDGIQGTKMELPPHVSNFTGRRKQPLNLNGGLEIALNICRAITTSNIGYDTGNHPPIGSTNSIVSEKLLQNFMQHFNNQDGSLPKIEIGKLLCWSIRQIIDERDGLIPMFATEILHSINIRRVLTNDELKVEQILRIKENKKRNTLEYDHKSIASLNELSKTLIFKTARSRDMRKELMLCVLSMC